MSLNFFTPGSNIGRKIQAILREFKDGLSLQNIKRELRKKGTHVSDVNSIRKILGDRDYFVQLSREKYTLKSLLMGYKEKTVLFSQDSFERKDKSPSIINLNNCLSSYVIFDLETTGFNSEEDKIIQISALKIVDEKPESFFDCYVNPSPVKISKNLKSILNLTSYHENIIYSSPGPEEVYGKFKDFSQGLPLLAYNLDFDFSFLKSIDENLENTGIDILELMVLTIPGLKSYKLEKIAGFFRILEENPEEKKIIEDLVRTFNIDFDWTGFHDAKIDVIYLYRVYLRLLEKFFSEKLPLYSYFFTKEQNDLMSVIKINTPPPLHHQETKDIDFSEETCLEFLDEYLEKKSYGKRQGQVDMIKLVFESIRDDTFKMIEAPTGTGKTLAYLIPSIVYSLSSGRKIAISTAVKNLQDQVIGEIKEFSEIMELKLNCKVLKGRNSYICIRKFISYISREDNFTDEESICLAYIMSWLNSTEEGTWNELSYWMEQKFPLLKDLKAALASCSDDCAGKSCPYSEECFRNKVYHMASHSQIIILNHSLWLSEPEDLPFFEKLILDEAHNLEDGATSCFTEEISVDIWEGFFKKIINLQTGRGYGPRLLAASRDKELAGQVRALLGSVNTCKKLVRDMGNHFKDFVKSCNANLDEKYGAVLRLERNPEKIASLKWYKTDEVKRQLNFYLKDLGEILLKLKEMIKERELSFKEEFLLNTSSLQRQFLENYNLFNEILKVNNIKKVCWIEVKERKGTSPFWALKSAPIEVAELLEERYSNLKTLVLTSATLSVKEGDFSFFAGRLGLNPSLGENNTHIIKGAIDYSKAFLALPRYIEYIPTPSTMDRFKEETSKELNYFLDFTNGKALVLFNSRERMEYAAEACYEYLLKKNIPLYFQEEGISRKAITEKFKEEKDSVLMGLKSFWEGVDIPGESLSFVIMEKLPFPYVFDPLYKARREEFALNPEKGNEFDDYIFPLMAIKFKQGFGRLLRNEEDKGCVMLLDRRIHKKIYKKNLLSSLPGYASDEEAENKRISLYKKIGSFLPHIINLEDKESFLENLPEEILLNIEEKLSNFSLPSVMSPADYEENRPLILSALKELFGYETFKSKEQENVIKAIFTGNDVLAVLKTGAGKSLCFQLTALLRKGATLIFSPLIALMKDQFYSLKERGLEIVDSIHSGQSRDEREEIYRRIREGKSRLIYISPERLRDPGLLEAIKDANIVNVIIDEAHCITMWGEAFRPDYLYINRLFEKINRQPPIAAFTATATAEIKRDIIKRMNMRKAVIIEGTFDRPELNLIVYNSASPFEAIRTKPDKFQLLLKILKAADLYRDPALIYVATTAEADRLSRKLRIMGFDIRSYHGKMPSDQRNTVQEMFMEGHINMVVCTKAFGMGIDKRDIRYVIHYNIPGDLESYFQEVGRAGRDGKESYAVLLYHGNDLNIQKFFNNSSLPDMEVINNILGFFRNSGKEKIYVDTLRMTDMFNLGESELKIIFHILESQGFIKRDLDFTLKAFITLFEMPGDIKEFVKEVYPKDLSLLRECFDYLSLFHYRKKEVNLLELGKVLEKDICEIENLFTVLSMKNKLRFSPFEKGNLIILTDKGKNCQDFRPHKEDKIFSYKRKIDEKLNIIDSYGRQQEVCRRKFILNYFGENYSQEKCGMCDLCVPEKRFPWSDMTGRDVPEICEFFDPFFTVLEITKYNHELKDIPYRNPYGKNSLALILTGNDYALVNHEENPKKRRARRKRIIEIPFFGLLDRIEGREKKVKSIFDQLEKEGYIRYCSSEYNLNGILKNYFYPIPTDKGYEKLDSGELFG